MADTYASGAYAVRRGSSSLPLGTMTKKINGIFLLVILLIQFIGGYFYTVIFPEPPLVTIIYVLTKVVMVALVVLLVFGGLELPKIFKWEGARKSLWGGLLSGLLMGAVIGVVAYILKDHFNLASAIGDKAELWGIGSMIWFIVFSVFLSIIHSLFEEVYWRWFAIGALGTRFSLLSATIISSLAFSLHHIFIINQLLPLSFALPFALIVGLGGYIWARQYQKSGNIAGAWLSHAIVDASIMLVGFILIY